MKLGKKDVPCYKCTDRDITCHSTCEKYKEFRKKVDAYKAAVNESILRDAPIKNYTIESKEKARRRH